MFHHDSPELRRNHDRNHDATYVVTLRTQPSLFARFWASLSPHEQARVREQLLNGGATTSELQSLGGGQ